MEPAASGDDHLQDEWLDALIPRSGPRWRPLLVAAIPLLCIWLVTAAWTNGQIAPLLDREGPPGGWGGLGPVFVSTGIRAHAQTTVDVVAGWSHPPGLELLGWRLGHIEEPLDAGVEDFDLIDDPFPIRVGPTDEGSGDGVVLTAVYDVVDCSALTSDARTIVLNRKIGPVSINRARVVDADRLVGWVDGSIENPFDEPREDLGWAHEIAQYACAAE